MSAWVGRGRRAMQQLAGAARSGPRRRRPRRAALLPGRSGSGTEAGGRHRAEVFADQWLLVHRDLRALPRVRAVMDAVIELFQRERALLEGRS